MARSYLDKIGLSHLWDLIKSYFVKGNAKVFTGTCFSDASATDKVVTCSEFASTDLVVGAIISVKFINTNSATASTITLNVNNTGSKGIRFIYNGSLSIIPNGNYLKANQLYQFIYDGTYWVVQLVNDTDTTNVLRDYWGMYTAGSVGLFPYTLIMQLPDGRWESIVTSSSNGTSKIKNSHGFLLDSILYKPTNPTITENNKDTTWQIQEHPDVCDYRYSFNISSTTGLALVAGKPIYLVGTIKADGLFYLADTWWTQTLPSTDDGKVYIYLGQVFDWYRGSLLVNNPIYWFKDGHVTNYINNDSAVNTDQQPYSFRKSGGRVVIGDTEYDKIIGASVVMNQLEKMNRVSGTSTNDIEYTNNGDGSFTLNGTATFLNRILPSNTSSSDEVINNHVYLAITDIASPSQDGVSVGIYVDTAAKKVEYKATAMYKPTSDSGPIQIGYRTAEGAVVNNLKIYGGLFDLTQFFGSPTIADYVYSLEQANAGDGVAWLRKYFPKIFDNGYISYNAGSFEHVSGLSEHKMVGFNQWDEEWEVGGIDGNAGQNIVNTDRIRSKNYIHVFPNTEYYLCYKGANNPSFYILQYDADKKFLVRTNHNINTIINVRSDCHYIKFFLYSSTPITVYSYDVCINISNTDKNGTYEPYEEHSYTLDSSLTLKGKFGLDENNNLIADGDMYEANGKVTGRYGVYTFTGNEIWGTYTAWGSDNTFMSGALSGVNITATTRQILTTVYPAAAFNDVLNGVVTGCILRKLDDNSIRLYFSDPNVTTIEQAKAKFPVGTMLVYPLATPTTEQATPYQNPQYVNEDGTEEYISTSIIPVGHYTEYPISKSLIRNVISNYDDIATQDKFGYISASDKTKLDGVATGAEVNQNTFSNVKVGTTTISANTKTDTLELVAGSNVILTPDATNDKVTIAVTLPIWDGTVT